MLKKLAPGIVAGLLLPLVVGALIYSLGPLFDKDNGGIALYFYGVFSGNYVFSPFVRLGCLVNLGVFFLLLRSNHDLWARGVLIGTIFWGLYVVITFLAR